MVPNRSSSAVQSARQRGDLDLASQVHNVVLIALSAWMAGSAVYWATQYGYRFWGNGFKASEKELGITIYVFYLSKFYEFFDTVSRRHAALCHISAEGMSICIMWCATAQFIMLLKGKSEQISLLHVYHHASISSIW